MKAIYGFFKDGKVTRTERLTPEQVIEMEATRQVGRDEKDGVLVSTVFLWVDHGWGEKPQWFETMVFGGPYDQAQERYETLEEAKAGHAAMVKKVLG